MKFADLVFYDLAPDEIAKLRANSPESVGGQWEDHPLRRAVATFPNGKCVSIVYGRWTFAFWESGMYELMEVDPSGVPVPLSQVRGDETVMQETMDRIEQWQTKVTA